MTPKIAYLTIDDAPSKDFPIKLDFLAEKAIPAVFFCTGTALEHHPDVVVEALRQGFVMANHGYRHQHFSDLSVEMCRQEISQTDQILADLYQKAGVNWLWKFFRFPYGDKGGLNWDDVFSAYSPEGLARKQEIQAHLRRLGYSQPAFAGITYQYYRSAGLLEDIDWHWTYDVREWGVAFGDHQFGIESLEAVFARMDEDEPEGCRGLNCPESEEIVLMHDHVETTEIFVPILERLLQKGLQFRHPLP